MSNTYDGIKEEYQKAFAANGDSAAAVLWPKGRQEERFNALTRHISPSSKFKILDFGCGLAHLNIYLKKHFDFYEYHGVDLVKEFVDHASKNFPGHSIKLVKNEKDVVEQYDHIVSSGAFNMLYLEDAEVHQEIVFSILTHLFGSCTQSLSVNFMTELVDYKQVGAFHQNLGRLYQFVSKNLSRRFLIDQSYLPFEFTITIFKNQEIKSPENIYIR